MIDCKFRLEFPTLDAKAWHKTLDLNMQRLLRQATRVWLKTIITRVPVLTGTAMGTLQPLGRFLNVAVANIPKLKKKGRGPEVGQSLQTFYFRYENGRYEFYYTNEVVYFFLNNYFQMERVRSAPWHALERANVAFTIFFINEVQKRVPKIADHITYTIHNVEPHL